LDRQSNFERERSHALHQELANGIIDLIADHSLAYRYSVLDTVTLADVLGQEPILTRVVPDSHPTPAYATNHQALQQYWAFPRRALTTVRSDGMSIFLKTSEVFLKLLPRDIAGVSILE